MIKKKKKMMFKPRRSFGSVFLTTACFLAFLGIIWHAYEGNLGQNKAGATVPIIRASNDMIKMRPTDEQGMQIAHQERLVFDQIEEPFAGRARDAENFRFGDNVEEDVVLKPSDAQLVKVSRTINKSRDAQTNAIEDIISASGDDDVDVAMNMNSDASAVTSAIGDVERNQALMKGAQRAETEDDLPDVNSQQEDVVVETKPSVQEQEPVIEQTITIEKTEAKQEPTPESSSVTSVPVQKKVEETPVTVGGDYFIQLGSVRSEDAARGEWKRIQSKFPVMLGDLSLTVEKADLGAKGVFYRIKAGDVTREKAAMICDEITSSKTAGCLPVKK